MLTKNEQREWDFDCRCQMVAADLWQGRSVTVTEQQLRFYNVTPHQVIESLAYWLASEEAEACWEAEHLYRGNCDKRTHVVYCTKRGATYAFKAIIKG